MTMRPSDPLTKKFMFALGFVLIFCLLLYSFIAFLYADKISEDAISNRLNEISHLATSTFSNPVWQYNTPMIISSAQALIQSNDIVHITVYGLEGLIHGLSKDLYANKPYSFFVNNPDFTAHTIPLFHNNIQIGELHIVIDSALIADKILIQSVTAIVSVGAMIIVMLFVSLLGGLFWLFHPSAESEMNQSM